MAKTKRKRNNALIKKLTKENNELRATGIVKQGSMLEKEFMRMDKEIKDRGGIIQGLVDVIAPLAVRVNNWIVSGSLIDEEKEELRLLCQNIIDEFLEKDTEISSVYPLISDYIKENP